MGEILTPANEPFRMKHVIRVSRRNNVFRLPIDFCSICGRSESTFRVNFQLFENNPVAKFAKLAGDAPSFLAARILNKEHSFEAPFCKQCFARFEKLEHKSQLFHLYFVLTIFAAILCAGFIATYLNFEFGLAVLGIGALAAVGVRLYWRYYLRQNSPRVQSFYQDKLVLKVPNRGEIRFELEASS